MIVSIDVLKPLEKVFPNHLKNLSNIILNIKIIQTPIIADQKTGIVVGCSHRYVFFSNMGIKKFLLDFSIIKMRTYG